MANYDSNYAIAQEISARIGVSPIPFDSVYSIALEIYNELGGEPAEFDSVYSILLGILPLVEGGIASKVIDDSVITTVKTWSSSKINEEIQAVAGTANSDIEEKSTIDFTFVESLPASGEEDQYVVINGENQDTLYKYVSGAWVEQTPDANALYFDTEGAALYSYVTADSQFAPIGLVDTIIVTGNLNSNAALKQIKTAGTYNVLQHLTSSTRGSYMKNWVLTVQAVDYDEYDSGDSVYQKMENNVTIYKRTWSGTRSSNDGWTVFSTYYEGLVKDTSTSKYYTWSSNKINSGLTLLDEKIENVKPIEEVSELPEASENKDKFVRLASDKKVYVSELVGTSTSEVNAPEAQQINNAYMTEIVSDIYNLYYKGIEYTLTDGTNSYTAYKWVNSEGFDVYTQYKASEYTNSDEIVIYQPGDGVWTDEGNNTLSAPSIYEDSFGGLGFAELYIVKQTVTTEEWDWEKVATEQYVDDAIDNIEFPEYVAGDGIAIDSANTISCTVKPIADVNALPNASENKDKLYRLDNGEKDVYAAKLLSSETTTTNRLPDDEQIDKAYLYESPSYDGIYYYKGAWKFILNDGEVEGYGWLAGVVEEDDWYLYLTQENAVNTTINTKALYTNVGIIDLENHSITIDDLVENYSLEDADTLEVNAAYPIPATYNVPEANQIGNAWLNFSTPVSPIYYTGEEYTFTYNGVTYNGYKWGNYIASSKPASEIYFYYDEDNSEYYRDVIFYSIEDNEIINPKNIYIPQLNAPDSEQVNQATLVFGSVGSDFYSKYTGEEVTLKLGNEEKQGYLWKENPGSLDGAFVTENDAEHTHGISDNCISLFSEGVVSYTDGVITLSEVEYSNLNWKTLENQGVRELQDFIPYQRTETTEEWGWEKVATEEYVNSAITNNVITGSATLLSDANMTVTGITNVVFDGYTETDLAQLDTADVKMNFEVTNNGTTLNIETVGRLSNMVTTHQGQTMSAMILISFNWTEMSSFKLTTLHIGYMQGLGWIANEK